MTRQRWSDGLFCAEGCKQIQLLRGHRADADGALVAELDAMFCSRRNSSSVVWTWSDTQGQAVAAPSAYVPLQFAWSEEGIVNGDVYRRVQMAHLKLCVSLAF